MWETPPLTSLQGCIADPFLPIGMRMRAAYFLRHLHDTQAADQDTIVETLANALLDPRHGSLMRHEFAYVMGQLRDERCCPVLETILQDDADCVMVRHEAAEALGAIGAQRSQQALMTVMEQSQDRPELSDTCQLAVNVMSWRANGGDPEQAPAQCACMMNPYSTVDPAPPHPSHINKTAEELGDILCNVQEQMFERYRAMFSLRNIGGADCVLQLCRALTKDASSPLLRHEVAYVLGQLQHPDSVEALEESLRRQDEHEMVRHESAEALGAIEGRWEDCERILEEFTKDQNIVVRESCMVALDAADYWGHTTCVNDEDDDDDDNNDPDDTGADTLAPNKSQSNDTSAPTPPNRILVNHFNVKD